MNIKHLVLDLETLDTTPTSVILSLGCSLFSFEKEENDFRYYVENGFYVKIDPVSQIKSGRSTSKGTIAWWRNQGKEAQTVLMPHKNDKSLPEALKLFREYLNQNEYNLKKSYCWSRGTYFDWPIVENAHLQYNLPLPYNGWKIRDIRTAIDILYGVDDGKYELKNGTPKEFIKHNSLHDCAMDILRLKELYSSLL